MSKIQEPKPTDKAEKKEKKHEASPSESPKKSKNKPTNHEYETKSAAGTIAIGRKLVEELTPPRLLILRGDLGAGKTTLVRAMLHALGHVGRVRSPTYTLVEPYLITRHDTALSVYHFDLYRFVDPTEWADAGFRDYFGSGALCLVEWPQQAGDLLGIPDLMFALELEAAAAHPAAQEPKPEPDPAAESGAAGRTLTAHAYTEIGKKCLERC